MHQRLPVRQLTLTATVTLALFASATGPADAAPDGDRPNVLFIGVDDLKPAIGAFGDERAITPNLDRLAGMGTAFLNAHCQQAVCAPSRVSLMTGLRPDTTRVWDLRTQFRPNLPGVVTLSQRFKDSGYATVGMGKIYDPRSAGGRSDMDAASWSEPHINVDAPADETYGYRNPEVVAHVQAMKQSKDLPRGYKKQLAVIFPEGKPSTDKAAVPDEAYRDGALTKVAKDRLKGFAESGEPFFLAVGFMKPHLPFNAPAKYWDMYDRKHFEIAEFQQAPEGAPDFAPQPGWELRSQYDAPDEGPISEAKQLELIHGYYACTSYIDAQIGELLDTLEETGLADRTVIVLWGDHGWHLGDHDIWCKHTNYEQATRSPLIVAAPGVGGRGQVNRSPVEFVDIYPTLLDLAGLESTSPYPLAGTSLVPILKDPDGRVKDLAISQYPRGGGPNARMGYAYRSDRYRLVQWRDQNAKGEGETTGPIVATELYDYEADPLETRNLADDPAYADVRGDLEAKAGSLWEANRPEPGAVPGASSGEPSEDSSE